MSSTQAAMLTVSQGIFAMSLSEKNCVALKKSISSCAENNAKETSVGETEKITKLSPGMIKEHMFGKMLGKRRHSSTPAPLRGRETPPRPRPRNAKSLTEIEVDTEIIDGLFTTTLCSTEL